MSWRLHRIFVLCLWLARTEPISLESSFCGIFPQDERWRVRIIEFGIFSPFKGLRTLFFLIIWMTKLVSRCLFPAFRYSQSIFFHHHHAAHFFSAQCFICTLEPWFYMLLWIASFVFFSWVVLCSHFIHFDADMLDIITRKRSKILHCRYFFTHLSNTLTRFFLVFL